ncbi:MAG TPA: polysaccharide deacetylase family protein [Mollicutes bacterium]|nr:polysaccharide deacetylase family protein [Mollicutes bacterium]
MNLNRQESLKKRKKHSCKYAKMILLEIAIGTILISSNFYFKKRNVAEGIAIVNDNEQNENENEEISMIIQPTSITPSVTPTPIIIDEAKNIKETVPEQPKKLVAITFDDGPSKSRTLKILDILERNNCTATFFVLGKNAKSMPDVIKKTYDAGHEIGNHTYEHTDYRTMSEDEALENFEKTQQVIKNITGEYPRLFRPRGGAYNEKMQEYLPCPLIWWKKDSNDWRSTLTDEEVTDNVLNGLKEGDIILFHDIQERTVSIVEDIIKKIQQKGFEIVSVSEMFDYYEIDLDNGTVYFSTYKKDALEKEEPVTKKEPIIKKNTNNTKTKTNNNNSNSNTHSKKMELLRMLKIYNNEIKTKIKHNNMYVKRICY